LQLRSSYRRQNFLQPGKAQKVIVPNALFAGISFTFSANVTVELAPVETSVISKYPVRGSAYAIDIIETINTAINDAIMVVFEIITITTICASYKNCLPILELGI
jgi:hypothetical protein